jgi:heme/copper-type cytochrome/quinol oxidase subunit 3
LNLRMIVSKLMCFFLIFRYCRWSNFFGLSYESCKIWFTFGFYVVYCFWNDVIFWFFLSFFSCGVMSSHRNGEYFSTTRNLYNICLRISAFYTFVLIISGLTVTWAHRAVSLGWYKQALDALLLTIFLGFFFVLLQMFEYWEAPFNYSDSVYGCSFYMLTGLHGFHVIVGACFLLVCFIRLLNRHFLTTHYLGFVFAIWYWHFVDAVWIFLFLTVYCWGSW